MSSRRKRIKFNKTILPNLNLRTNPSLWVERQQRTTLCLLRQKTQEYFLQTMQSLFCLGQKKKKPQGPNQMDHRTNKHPVLKSKKRRLDRYSDYLNKAIIYLLFNRPKTQLEEFSLTNQKSNKTKMETYSVKE